MVEQKNLNAQTAKSKPDVTTRAGKFKIAKWVNEQEIRGQQVHVVSYTLTKSWKKGDEWHEWKGTIFPEELSDLLILISDVMNKDRIKRE